MPTKSAVEKHPKSKAVVRFQDCDPLGHLNNGRYLDYFMNAREDHLKHFYNFDIYQIVKEHGFAWVVAQHQIAYLKPVFLMEEVVIQSSVIDFNDHSILVELSMWDHSERKLKSVLWSKFVSINASTGKKTNMPPFVKDLLKDVHTNHVDLSAGFDARVGKLLNRD